VHESRALGVNRRSLQILEPCGATRRLLEIGQRPKALRFHTPRSELFHIAFAQTDIPVVLVVPQSEMEEVLVEVLAGYGVQVEWRTELVALADPQDPLVELRGSAGVETGSADLLIGADGAHSRVRHELGLAFPGSAYETEWGLLDARVATSLSLEDVHAFDLAPVLFAAIPIRENLVRFVCDHRDVLAHAPPQFDVLSVEWESPFRISHRQVETYQKQNVFLAGDAAHIHSPIGARGMNLGIEDAAWLAWMIAEGKTECYTAERRPVGRRVLRTVDPATRLLASDLSSLTFVRRHVVPLAIGIAPLRNRMIERMTGMSTPAPPWLPQKSG
jgi:2-polyprenyl-6-methoxyphenol hydroxylase-like FAD-dependent oxidoreductase